MTTLADPNVVAKLRRHNRRNRVSGTAHPRPWQTLDYIILLKQDRKTPNGD